MFKKFLSVCRLIQEFLAFFCKKFLGATYQKIIGICFLVFTFPLISISTTMNHRLVSSAPLQYKQIDYSEQRLSFEIEPWFSEMFNPEHTMENLGINGKSSMILNELGFRDINPQYVLLESMDSDYTSLMDLNPDLFMVGALLHFYRQYEYIFFDIKTAILYCKTIINVEEAGGGNGSLQDSIGQTIYNAYDAFTQADWKYAKFGDANSVTGLDNIQLTIGSSTQLGSISSDQCNFYVAGFALIEIPTGTGTKSEWLFEPQVGTNHWAFGFGTDFMACTHHEVSVVFGGNYRYILGNWETRSFDLIMNGQWSRYLGIELIEDLDTGLIVPGAQGINLFTQDALIDGKNQVNVYARVQKKIEACLFEFSYNFFYNQQETITKIDTIETGYGIFNVSSGSGDTTASTATIAQANPVADIAPVTLVTNDLDLASGAAGQWISNTFAFRLQTVKEPYTYGFGGSIDFANSAQAISTWSIWANFEVLFS